MSKAMWAIAAAAGVAAIKKGMSGSFSKIGDHNIGKTGNNPMDIFEGSQPKTWFSLHFEDLYHPNDHRQVKEVLNIQHKLMTRVVIDTVRAGLTMKQFMNLYRDPIAQKKYYEYLVSKKRNPTQKYKNEVLERISEDLNYIKQHMVASPAASHSMSMHWAWFNNGSNVVVLGPNMQAMFENTGLQDIKLDNIDMPYNSIYVALPGFDGRLFDYQSGYHDIRGVFIAKMPENLRKDGNLGYAVSVWGKPKEGTGISGYDDSFVWSGVDNVAGENIEQFLRRSYEDATVRKQPPDAIEDLIRATKIAFNVIMYWGTLRDEEEWIHPDTLEKLNKIKDLEDRARNTKKRKRKQGLVDTVRNLENQISQSGKFFWLERGDEDFTEGSDKPVTPRGPLGKERKSPRAHIRKGHHRIIHPETEREKVIWIKPMMIGSKIAPRYWKTLLDKKGSNNQDSEFSLVRVEKKRAGWSGRQMMRSLQRTGIPPHMGGGHDPHKITGLAITIEGKDPMKLQRYQQGGIFAQRIASENGLFNPFMTLRNVYRSNRKADCWEAVWDAR